MSGQIVKSMHSIQGEFLELMESIEENDGFLTEEQDEALKINEEEIMEKTNKYGHMIDRFGVEKTLVADKIKQLQAYKKSLDNMEKKFKANVLSAMGLYGFDKLETESFKFSVRKSETVSIECEAWELPEDCRVVEFKPISKTELKKMLKDGREIEDVSINKNKSLTVKSK